MTINHLLHRDAGLKNTFYALRHGQSLANVAKIISSDPSISTVQHGLSDIGKEQAKRAGEQFAIDYYCSDDNASSSGCSWYEGVAIFSSDFTRARETASIFAQSLTTTTTSSLPSPPSKQITIPIYNHQVQLETRLRERYFGILNGGPDTQYQKVWSIDCIDPNHHEFDVESANEVLERTTRLVIELDDMLSSTSSFSGSIHNNKRWKVILVAHGDVLQILQTGFLKHEDASRHRSLVHLETATIRELTLLSNKEIEREEEVQE